MNGIKKGCVKNYDVTSNYGAEKALKLFTPMRLTRYKRRNEIHLLQTIFKCLHINNDDLFLGKPFLKI